MQLAGTAANDVLVGSATDDTLDGGAGDDTLNGGSGNDSVSGGDGNDLFQLDYGNDTLRGGSGADVFTFNSATGNDLIVDFAPALDRINTGGWAALNGVRFSLDASGNTLLTIAGLSNITLQGVTQTQWGSIREADGSALYTPSTTPTDDYAASSATTGRVTVGGSGTSGRIETGSDTDWFAVDITAGTSYTFTLNGVGGGGGTLVDPYLGLVSATGTLLAYDDDSGVGLDSQITYTPTATGRYYLVAAGLSSTDLGTYRLVASASISPVIDDYPGSTGTAGTVPLDGSAQTGFIDFAGDKDWFAINVTAGTQYRFNVEGAALNRGTLADPFLELMSSTGVRIAFDNDSGALTDSYLSYTATSTGRLYLSVSSNSPSGLGSYRVTAAPDDYPGSISTATGRIAAGGTVSGRIEVSGDGDYFMLDAVAGTQYTITMSGVDGGGGTLANPSLELRLPTGALATSDRDSGTGLDAQIVYTATATGLLYIYATGTGSGTGSYRLTATTPATTPPTDDYAASAATTGSVIVRGAPTSGTIETSGDKDWFAVDLIAGNHYIFTLSGADGGGGTLANPILQLMYVGGTSTATAPDDDSGTGLDSQITYTSHLTGRYYLSVASSPTLPTGTGSYRISATAIPDDQVSGTMTTGRVVVGSAGTTGTIEVPGDVDYFGVNVTAGNRYRFTLSGVDGAGGTLPDPYLTVWSMLIGDFVAQDNDSGTGRDAQVTYTAPNTETLYLSVEALRRTDSNIGTYRLTAELVAPLTPTDDHAASTETMGRVAIGGAAATGTIETSGDKDWFAIDVTAGTRYRFTLSGTGDGGGTLSNPYLELLSPAGLRQAFDDDTGPGSDSLLIYTATSTGRLYLSASASSISPTATGTYRLLAETIPDDYADNSGTVGTVMAGGSITGMIEISGDKDWFAIDVTQGTQYLFNLSGRDGGGGTVADPNLELRSSTGSVLAADYDGGTGLDSQLSYTATSTGRIYVAVSAGSIFTPNTGSYRLTATRVEVVDDYAGSSATTGVVAVGGSVTGNLEVLGDNDWFAADLVAGTRYIVSLSGRDDGSGTLMDPLLQVRSSTGVLLHQDDDSGVGSGSEISFVATTTGRHYFAASGYDGAYTGTYKLSLTTPPPDDYAGSTATTGQLAVGGTVSGRLEVAADQDWFAIDLVAGRTYSFSLSGLDGGGGSLDDPWLRLLDANGTRLAFDDDSGTGTDSLLTFTATVSGRYYLSAEGASDKETGTYRLSALVAEPPPADPAGVRGGTPSDPLFAQQWHLNGTFGINVLPVWADYTGVGIRVGVLDQGIEARHRDLDDNLLTALSTVAASGAAGGTPLLVDDNHGTAVAGVIAAERNGFGGVGVAYNADLVSYYDPLNSGTAVFAATTAATYLRSIGVVDVLNNSWGYGNFFKSTPNRAFLDDFDSTPFNVSGAALARLAAEGRGGKGTVVVQSAGNTGEYGDDTNLHNFQNSRFVITVAATTSSGALASFSTPGASVLVAAPGVGIVTSDRTGTAGYAAGDSASLDGTSFSAPAVAGVVALMLEANADLGYRDVQEILALSARKISPSASSWINNGATGWNGGGMHFSEGFGFGLVDARAAVRLAETWQGAQTRANEASLTASRILSPSLSIPDNNSQGVSSTLNLAGDVTIDRVEIDLNITHSWIGDLRITLTSPSGTAINLVDRPGQGRLSNLGSSQDNVNFTFGVTGLMGERASGTWTLTLSDRDGGIVGALESWSLRAYGNAGSADDNHVFTDEFTDLVAAAASRGTITDTDGGIDTLNAAAVTGAVSFNLGAGTGSIAGKSITFTANAFERAIGGDAADSLTAGGIAAALLGGRGADTLTGGAGFDTLTGGAGDDRLIGGGGIDIAVFAGDRSTFTLTRDGDGFLLTGTEGSDRLSGVELAVFNRGALFLGSAGASLFNEAGYLAANPDVAAAVRAGALSSGQSHYEAFGRAEGRPGAGGLSLFDEAFYLSRYPDIASAVRTGVFESGYAHYQMHGRAEGRNPSLYFDTAYYLAKNPDVAGAVRTGAILAVDHYLNYGLNEGRAASPYFNAADYLRINPDVAAAGLNAVWHFLAHGYAEGRLAGIDWDYFG